MDLDMIEEAVTPGVGVVCELCGNTEFTCIGGFFFCQECQTQSQDAREFVERDDFDQRVSHLGRAAKFHERGPGGKSTHEREPLERVSVFEAFNCCLEMASNRLIEMGFPATLKKQVFTLWTKYLRRRRAIFVYRDTELESAAKTPWICYWVRPKSSRLHYNRRRRFKRHKPTKVDESLLSRSVQKRRQTQIKKKAMETSYSVQLAEMMEQVPETWSPLPKKKFKVNQFTKSALLRRASKLTKQSRQVLFALRCKGLNTAREEGLRLSLLTPEVFTMKSFLTLLFISLRQVGCKVCMTDVIRLFWTGKIYFSSLRPILQKNNVMNESRRISPEIDLVLSNEIHHFLSIKYSDTIKNMLVYLSLSSDFRYPEFKEFLPKFIDDLALPREIECLILQIEKVIPTTTEEFVTTRPYLQKMSKILPEFHILAVIIIVLRLLFGLDDVTERYQSDFAQKINSILEESGSNNEYSKLFVIKDWFLYLRQRTKVVDGELHNPYFTTGTSNLPYHTMNHFIQNYTGFRVQENAPPNRVTARHNITEMFENYAAANGEIPRTIPRHVGLSLPEEEVLHEYQKNYPAVLNPTPMGPPAHLNQSFTKTRIDFIFNPNKYVTLLQGHGYNGNVLDGDARCNDLEEDNDDATFTLFQPYNQFDDHIPRSFAQPHSLKFILDLCSRMLIGCHKDSGSRGTLEFYMDHLQRFYTRHLILGVLKIFPYDMHDSDATTDSDSD